MKVSAYVDDITVFVTYLSDIEAVKKAIMGYKQIAGTKINFDESKGLVVRCLERVAFSYLVLSTEVTESSASLELWFGSGFQLNQNWSEILAKLKAQVATWLQRGFVLKRQGWKCVLCTYSL